MSFRRSALAGAVSLLAFATPAPAQDGEPMQHTAVDQVAGAYPVTERGDTVETIFGEEIADPYRWLENDVRKDPEVAAWVAAENKVTDAFLDTLPLKDAFQKRMTELYDYERFGVPVKKGGRYFYTRNDGLQNQSVLYVREGLDGTPRMLIDPNTWSQDGATALEMYSHYVPDIVITDWAMPGLDGTQLIARIRSAADAPSGPAI